MSEILLVDYISIFFYYDKREYTLLAALISPCLSTFFGLVDVHLLTYRLLYDILTEEPTFKGFISCRFRAVFDDQNSWMFVDTEVPATTFNTIVQPVPIKEFCSFYWLADWLTGHAQWNAERTLHNTAENADHLVLLACCVSTWTTFVVKRPITQKAVPKFLKKMYNTGTRIRSKLKKFRGINVRWPHKSY